MTEIAIRPSAGPRRYVRPVVTGVAIAVLGVVPWAVLAPLNARIRPDLPWAALLTTLFLIALMSWLHGVGWPQRTSAKRKRNLRLWPPRPARDAGTVPATLIVLGLALLYVLWIVLGSAGGPPDLSPYPTTAFRLSVLIMGAVVSGVVEEAAFRGYTLAGLEPYGPETAILITSATFTLMHAVHGIGTLLLLGPGMFAASVLYCLLTRRTGTILPGIVIHTLGDLAHTYFGLLGGDGSLLFVR